MTVNVHDHEFEQDISLIQNDLIVFLNGLLSLLMNSVVLQA